MDQMDPKPVQRLQGQLVSWLGTTGFVLSFIGSWLILGAVLASIIAGPPPNKNVWYCGFLLCGLGGSLFAKACFVYERVPEAGTLARFRHFLKLASVMLLTTVAAPFLAAWAFGFGALLTFTLVPWIIALRVKRLLGFVPEDWSRS